MPMNYSHGNPIWEIIIPQELGQPIPKQLPKVDGWKTHPVKDNGEPLVPLGIFTEYSSKKIVTEAVYYGETDKSPYQHNKLNGALITPFVRQGVAEKLVVAAEMLPEGMYLLVLDAYRPLAVQQALFDDFFNQLVEKGLSAEEAKDEAQRFVSIPSDDPTRPSPHNTGGSVDLTIIQVDYETQEAIFEQDRIIESCSDNEELWEAVYTAQIRKMSLLRNNGKEMDMGTAFDEVSPATATSYYENKEHLDLDEKNIRDNRHILYNVMTKAGFSNYDEEWWHFDYGNQFDAIRTGKDAIYSTAHFSDENKQWENTMHAHYHGLSELTANKKTADNAIAQFVQETGKIVQMENGCWSKSALALNAKRLTA